MISAMLVALAPSIAACSDQDSTDITYDGRLNDRFYERCQSNPDGSVGDLSGVFDEEWDEITFAISGANNAEVAEKSGALWSEDYKKKRVFDEIIVLTKGGVGVRAYDAEGVPFRFVNEGKDVITVPFPGEFYIKQRACWFEESAQ